MSLTSGSRFPDMYGSQNLKMVSGYDLLDKLSRRRMYARANVREKTCLSETFDTSYECITPTDIGIEVEGLGLMERTSIDPRRSRTMPWFEDSRASYQHHADYLKKLSTLRDELIIQEQVHLANALDRLRMRQYGKDSMLFRNRSRDGAADLSPRKTLVTTVEHFQKMRPKRSPPHISPLEGKQILEPQPINSRSPQFTGTSTTPQNSMDESIRTNLQRINIQPTSSIPNIGRKSITKSKELVLDGSPIHRRRTLKSRDERETQDVNPFKAVHKGKGTRFPRVTRPESEDLDLSPQTIKFETFGDKDQINLDKLKEYYCIYYLPTNTPTDLSEDEETSGNDKIRVTGSFQRPKKKRISLLEGKSMSPYINDNKLLKINRLQHRPNSIDSELENERQSYEHFSIYGEKSMSPTRRQIVVDMPSIVFNNATPDKTESDLEQKHVTLLHKTYKQNELRQRELKNLFDDVRELNKRTDELSGSIKSTD